MFSLIITIVAIALVVALVAATLYHGGDTLSAGRDTAEAAGLTNFGQQISLALHVKDALQSEPPTANQTVLADSLAPQYMASVPASWLIRCGESLCEITKDIPDTDTDTCLAVNKAAGLGSVVTLTVYEMTHAPYFCLERLDGDGLLVNYQFSYIYRR